MNSNRVPLKLNQLTLGVLVSVILFGGIGLSAALNSWHTTNTKVPAKYESGEFAGAANPADIRGSYTLSDIEQAFAVPVDVLARAFGVGDADNPAAFQVKGLEERYGALGGELEVGTDSMRLFVALYRGLPYTPAEDTGLPDPAASILRQLGTLGEEQLALVDSHVVADGHRVALDGGGQEAAPDTPAEASGEHAESAAGEDRAIKGKTTFAELLGWGLTGEEIEAVTGRPMGPRTMALRDWAQAEGLEFSAFKTGLQEKVDALE